MGTALSTPREPLVLTPYTSWLWHLLGRLDAAPWPLPEQVDARVARKTLGSEAGVPTRIQVRTCSRSHCGIKAPRWVPRGTHPHTGKGPPCPLQHFPTALTVSGGVGHNLSSVPLLHLEPLGRLLLVIRPPESLPVPLYTELAAPPLCLHRPGLASPIASIPEGFHCLLISLSSPLGRLCLM